MKITICGSIAFYKQMELVTAELKAMGHEVKLPPNKIKDDNGNSICVIDYYNMRKKDLPEKWLWDRKQEAIIKHFEKIEWSEAILVLNYDKNGITGYVGANTLIEMGLALYLNKPIYLLNQIPEINYKEEILGMKPILINQDLSKLKK